MSKVKKPKLKREVTEAYLLTESEQGDVDLVPFTGQGSQKSNKDLKKLDLRQLDVIVKSLGVTGSTQTEFIDSTSADRTVAPPYDPNIMTALSQLDEVSWACARAKAFDATKRHFSLDRNWDPLISEEVEQVTDEEFAKEARIARKFLKTCHGPYPDFQEILYKTQLDVENIGWGALEVVRSADGIVRTLTHIPASRVRPLQGWQGFQELGSNGKKIYYQPFGTKVVAKNRLNPITEDPEYYDPEDDGELNIALNEALDFKLMDRTTGKFSTSVTFKKSANELIWLTKTHPATIYYGISDNLPAMGHIIGNYHISNYLLQYFEHNTVPRYIVLIKGGRLDDPVKKAIVEFFRTQVKGRAHQTLVVPIPGGPGGIEVELKAVDTGDRGDWFLEVQKEKQHSIRLAHDVPAAVAGFSDNASLGSGKGNSQLEMYRDRYVSPAQRSMSDTITRIFRLGLGLTKVRGRFEELDVREQEALMRILTAYQDRGDVDTNDVRRLAKLGPPLKGGDRKYRVIGKNLIFVDEIKEMESTIGLNSSDNEDNDNRGGDQRNVVPEKLAPENTVQTAAEAALNGDS